MATKRAKGKGRQAASKSASRGAKRPTPPIPPGFRTMTPYLCVERAIEAMEFYQRAFGARKLLLNLTPDGKVLHGRLRIGDSILMLSDTFPGSGLAAPTGIGATTVTLHLYSKNVDALFARAVAAGATVAMPLADQFWGERYGQVTDPFGHRWSLSQQIAMTPAEKKRLEAAAMAMMANAHAGDTSPP